MTRTIDLNKEIIKDVYFMSNEKRFFIVYEVDKEAYEKWRGALKDE